MAKIQGGDDRALLSKLSRLEEIIENIERDNREFKERAQRDNMIKLVLSGIIALMLVFFVTMLYKTYSLFKSPEFLDGLQYKIMELSPELQRQVVETINKEGPKWIDMLKERTENFVPKLADDVNTKYLPAFFDQVQAQSDAYTKRVLSGVQDNVHNFLYQELDRVFQDIAKNSDLVAQIKDDKFDEINKLIIDKFDQGVAQQLESEMAKNLDTCIDQGDRLLDSLSEFKNLPADKRQGMAFDIMRGFIDTLDYVQTGKTYGSTFRGEPSSDTQVSPTEKAKPAKK